LKSILKGATEDIEQPSSLEDIRSASIPRTNPVNLIFVLAQFAPKISEMHFDVPRDFFDLVMKSGLSSRSRATAFLWLMWWYLESDFSTKDALANPYGPGRRSRDADEREMPIKCPQFEYLTDEQALQENVDTQEEIDFGELKRKERVGMFPCISWFTHWLTNWKWQLFSPLTWPLSSPVLKGRARRVSYYSKVACQ
jgi:Ino eighty subunit 1